MKMGKRGAKDTNKEHEMVNNVLLCRQFLKGKIFSSDVYDNRFQEQYEQLINVLQKTIVFGESDSLLIIGPRGLGKSTVSYMDSLNVHMNPYLMNK